MVASPFELLERAREILPDFRGPAGANDLGRQFTASDTPGDFVKRSLMSQELITETVVRLVELSHAAKERVTGL